MTETSHSLPLKVCIGWGLGTFGVSIMFNSITVIMPRYATDFLGVAAGTWGLLFILSKVYDGVTDPIMGVLSDRTSSKIGRRRRYLLLGAVVSALAFVGLFWVPVSISQNATLWMLFAALILYSTGYTIFNVPYMAMLPEMTSDYTERARLVSFRVYGVALGTVVGLSMGPFLVDFYQDGHAGHRAMALLFAGLASLSMFVCFWLTRDAPMIEHTHKRDISFRQGVSLMWHNKPFMRIIGLKLTQLASVALNQTLLLYFVIHVLAKDYQFFGVYGLIAASCTLLGPWLSLKLMSRFDKREIYLYAGIIHSLLMLTWLFSGPQEPTAIVIARGAILGLTAGAMIMMGQAMLPDTISLETMQTGLHREGVYSGLYTTTEKVSFALGGAMAAFILSMAGYVSSTTGTVQQPQSAIYAIYLCVGVLPAILAAVSCLFLIGYDLSEEKLQQLRQAHHS